MPRLRTFVIKTGGDVEKARELYNEFFREYRKEKPDHFRGYWRKYKAKRKVEKGRK